MTLTVNDVHAGYGAATVLHGVSFELPPGKALAVLGASGTGKTTLTRCLTGEVRPTSGTILLHRTDVTTLSAEGLQRLRREDLGLVEPVPDFFPELSVVENIALPLLAQGRPRRACLDAAVAALRALDLDELDTRSVTALSPSDLQRCAVARATVKPELRLLIADEPTSRLDGHAAHVVAAELIAAAHDRDLPLVLTTNDPRVAQLCDYFLPLGEDFPGVTPADESDEPDAS